MEVRQSILRVFLLFFSLTIAESLYPKSSPILQVTSATYHNLIEKSNYTSIIEFYAPWCGHCKNLAPAYAKAAQSLLGYANVAAINCDEESNKAFCGQMGVQGFPTLKIVKPKKKGGKPLIEDYQGERTAKAIKEAVLDKMPNHVTKVTDKNMDTWLNTEKKRPKVAFFSEKGSISPLAKSIAIEFLGSMDVGQVRSSESLATHRFMVETFPGAAFLLTGEHAPQLYEGKEMNKAAIMNWLKTFEGVNPNPPPKAEKPKPAKKDKKAKKESVKETPEVPVPPAASETLNDESNPTESPDPNVATESPAPVQLPVAVMRDIPRLDSEDALQKSCLNIKSGTCVLAIVSPGATVQQTGVRSLSLVAHRHAQRKSKLFPFYEVPETNKAGEALVSTLGVNDPAAPVAMLAINAKRGWWTEYIGTDLSRDALESWVDNIRFGDFVKNKLPESVVKEAEVKIEKEQRKVEESPIKVEHIEVLEDFVFPPPHEEL